MTCMKLLASSIPGSESAKSDSSSFARPLSPAEIKRENRDSIIRHCSVQLACGTIYRTNRGFPLAHPPASHQHQLV